MLECRNCGSDEIKDLGAIARIAPFFLKRVFDIEMRAPVSPSPAKQFLRRLGSPFRRLGRWMYSDAAYLHVQICRRCAFVQARSPFPEDWITRLYLDYRSESYNRERTYFEPSYAAIAARVGVDDAEVKNRVAAATTFVSAHLQPTPEFSMLDYGGADGRFLPQIDAQKFVFEISDIAPIEGVQRVPTEAELERYDYVHLAHVLEHVVHPLALVRKVCALVKDGGYLYIEVPQEVPDEDLARLQTASPHRELNLHEHINAYSQSALAHLLQAAGLTVVAMQADLMNVGWAKATHLRVLGKKASPDD